MTEEEARKKWCPHIRVVGSNRDNRTTPPKLEQKFRCIASDCMMWEETTELVGSPPDEYYSTDGDCGLKRKTYD